MLLRCCPGLQSWISAARVSLYLFLHLYRAAGVGCIMCVSVRRVLFSLSRTRIAFMVYGTLGTYDGKYLACQ